MWFGIEGILTDPFNIHSPDAEGNIDGTMERIANVMKNIERVKFQLLTENRPFVAVINELTGIRGLFFQTESINIIIPYLSELDYSEEAESVIVSNILESNGDNQFILADLDEYLVELHGLRRLDFEKF